MVYNTFVSILVTAFLLIFSSISSAATDSEVEELKEEIETLKERLEDVEEATEEVSEKTGNRAIVQAFDGIKLDIGGFLHSVYTYVDGEDNSEGSFNRQNFELLIGSELSESWSAFIAGGFLREANDPFTVGDRRNPQFDTNNRSPLIIGWANYSYNDQANIRIGRIITPHGVINIEHFPATLLDPEQPQFLRPFGGNTIFPNFSTGLQFHGKSFTNAGVLSYTTYLTNATGTGNANDEEIFGLRAALGSSAGKWEIGLNFSDSYRSATDSDNDMLGLDFRFRHSMGRSGFELKSEYYATEEQNGGDREAYYVQPIWHFNAEWLAFYRFDFLDSGDVAGESTENALGINYLPNENVRLRFIVTGKEFEGGYTDGTLTTPLEDADATILQISGTFSF